MVILTEIWWIDLFLFNIGYDIEDFFYFFIGELSNFSYSGIYLPISLLSADVLAFPADSGCEFADFFALNFWNLFSVFSSFKDAWDFLNGFFFAEF